ncbi:lipopolysaccharide biosynthesis protein [Tianweitania sp. BSSL-BM11]|uniref:Lipopolysaccharide biosynthesis protein n=1 Tax=Tianweitania aestuarii TaxID=2814886 RepID=A0ABS5S1N7_9HYPH|nr:lipopolysaccharide biosynthesis protein [Tianweitania aestuarii]
MRFSAATTAERFLPKRLASRARPLLDQVDALLIPRDARDQAGRISLIAFAIRILSAAIAFISQVFMARWMGSFEYGIFVLVWVAVVILGNLSCFGFHTAVIRFIPEYRETGRPDHLRGILFGSRIFTLVASSLIAALGALGLYLFSGSVEPYYIVPFALGIVMLPMIALSDTLQGIARANAWAVAALAPAYVVRPTLLLLFMAGLLLAGWEPDAQTSLIAAIAATYCTALYQVFSVTGPADRVVGHGPRHIDMRTWLAVSLPIFFIEGFTFLLTNADVLIVGFYLEPHDVAIYYATVKTLALVHFVYFAVKTGAAQRYAQLIHAGETSRLADFARETVSWTFWPSVGMGVFVLAAGWPLLSLFGAEFTAGYPLLFVLVAGVIARASVGPAESLLTMSGQQNICAGVYAATLAVNLVCNAVLIPQIGLWGAAVATSAAMIFEAIALAVVVWIKLGLVMVIGLQATPARGRSS